MCICFFLVVDMINKELVVDVVHALDLCIYLFILNAFSILMVIVFSIVQ